MQCVTKRSCLTSFLLRSKFAAERGIKCFMSIPRKHHFLPKFYLQGFSIDDRSIYQVEKASQRFYKQSINDTGAIRDFFIDDSQCDDPFHIEKTFSLLEGELSNDLNNVVSNGISDLNSLGEVVGLLLLLRIRVPAVKEHIEQSLIASQKNALKTLDRQGKLPRRPLGYEDELAIDKLNIVIANWKLIETMLKMASEPKVLNIVSNMRATLYRCDDNGYFFTCDQPVALVDPSYKINTQNGIGPASPTVEITMPLTKKALLKLDHKPGHHCEKLATDNEVKEFNRRTIIMANKYIFMGHNPSNEMPQISKNSRTYSGFKSSDIEIQDGYLHIHRFIPVPLVSTNDGT